MKSILIITLYVLFCAQQPSPQSLVVVGQHQLRLDEAERILGEPAILKERKSDNQTDYYTSSSTFTAKDSLSQKQRNLYYKIERFKNEKEATTTIQSFINSNKNLQGFELLTGYDDEAFFLTDKENFCLIVIRISNKLVRIKVNKVTSKTSFEALRAIGKSFVNRV
jgi:glutathione synthase/RimK-type ligase-like ATP-grasp enzyme